MPRRKRDPQEQKPAAGGESSSEPNAPRSGSAAPAAWRQVRQEASELGDVQQLLEALADAGERIVIMRQRGDRFAYVTTLAAGSFSLEWVKRNLGGGVFRANAIIPHPKGDRMVTSATFAIEGPPREYARDSDGSPLEGPPAAAPAAPSNPTSDMAAAMMGMAMQAMKGMADAFSAMSKVQQAPAPQVDPLAVLEKAASIFRHGEPTRTPATEIAAAIREGMELGSLAAGGGGDRGGDNAMAAIAPAIGPLASALASRLEAETAIKRAQVARFNRPAGSPVPITPPAAPGAPGEPVRRAAATAAPAAPAFGDWRDQLTPLVPYLVTLARSNQNPRAEAIRLLEEAPAKVVSTLDDAVNASPNFVSHIIESYPTMREASVAEWFREFVAAVDAELRDSDTNDQDESDE